MASIPVAPLTVLVDAVGGGQVLEARTLTWWVQSVSGSLGGSGPIAARSSSMRSDGRHRNVAWTRTFARVSSQSPTWVLKSSTDPNPLRSGQPGANTTFPARRDEIAGSPSYTPTLGTAPTRPGTSGAR